MFSVVFVCTGNTCRSPMAEAIARGELGGDDEDIEVSSAGLAALDGAPAANHAVFLIHDRGGDLSEHRSRFLSDALAQSADLLVTMTRSHRDELRRRYPSRHASIVTLAELGAEGSRADIADPFGGGLQEYESAYDEIERHVRAALPVIRSRARG